MAKHPDPAEPTDDPLAIARGRSFESLLALLEELDGAEEAAVVRNAVDAGVSKTAAFDELQREVERRLLRRHSFYEHLRD